MSLPSIQRHRSLHEQTYQALRASILSGNLAPGERLVETQLAEQLQVSRTPIREAIRQLQREELITADANGSLRVSTISTTDAIQLYDCRIALEQLSVAQACEHSIPEQLQYIEGAILQAEALTNSNTVKPDSLELLHLDYQFHRAIAESSGNKWLVSLLEQVFDKMALLRIQTTAHNPNVLEIRQEHRQIYEAIVLRDQATAVRAIQAHLNASKARVVREVELLHQERQHCSSQN